MTRSPLRVVYIAGPGDVVGTFRYWQRREDDPSQVAITYSAQFFDVCRDLNAGGYVISSCPRRERVADGRFIIENRPHCMANARGVLFHIGRILYGLGLILSAFRYRAHLVVGGQHGTHLFVFALLRLLGIRFVPSLHCVLWPQFAPLSRTQKLMKWLDAFALRRAADGVMCVSRDIEAQVEELTGRRCPPRVSFLPTYRRETFSDVPPPPARGVFRVLYAGRVERDKGVFGLLDICRQLASAGRDIAFDICGEGSALSELREKARSLGLDSRVRCPGHLTRVQMRELFGGCGVVIVPTTSSFVEGFNKVVVEAVLAQRPVITSTVCPAIGYVTPAVYVSRVDDWDCYRDRIVEAAGRDAGYWTRVAACERVAAPFFGGGWGFSNALECVIRAIAEGTAIAERRFPCKTE